MPHIAANAQSYEKQSIGNGQCVAFVRAASRAPHTSVWKQGNLVKAANTIFPGTAIATFDPDGKYGNREDGTSHAAIFIRKLATGQLSGGDTVTSWLRNPKVSPPGTRSNVCRIN